MSNLFQAVGSASYFYTQSSGVVAAEDRQQISGENQITG